MQYHRNVGTSKELLTIIGGYMPHCDSSERKVSKETRCELDRSMGGYWNISKKYNILNQKRLAKRDDSLPESCIPKN